MSLTVEDKSFKFLPFDTIVENGLKHMLDFVKSNSFTFIVNGYHFESTVAEAILISPAVYETLLQDPSVSTFSISDSEIDSKDFVQFVQLFHSNKSIESTVPALSLLSIFRLLGNESFSLLLLTSMHSRISESESESESVSNSTTDSTRMPI
jgi:hypothetical protein